MNSIKPLNIIFAGTPEFSTPPLQALIDSPHRVIAAYTQPDRKAGRGRKLQASPVKQLAQSAQIPVYQPVTLRDQHAQETLANLQADLMVVVAYGLILPREVLNAPHYGCINIHASLLPRWRGAAPIQRAILAGDTTSGVTLMQMDEGLDTGAMLTRETLPLSSATTSATLHDQLSILGAKLLLPTIEGIQQGNLEPEQQDEAQATYAKKIEKSDAKIDWQKSAVEIEREVRAYQPWPVSFCEKDGEKVRVWSAKSLSASTTKVPGTILAVSDTGIDVATAAGILQLQRLQLAGGKPLPCKELLNAKRHLFLPETTFS